MTEPDLRIKMGSRIKLIRVQKNMTQNELAMECNFEKATMSRIESGHSNTTIRTLFRISKALNVHIGEFFTD